MYYCAKERKEKYQELKEKQTTTPPPVETESKEPQSVGRPKTDDAKIQKATEAFEKAKQTLLSLKQEKAQAVKDARAKYKSDMTTRMNNMNNKATGLEGDSAQYSDKGREMMNRRRSSLGLDPAQASANKKMVAESEFNKMFKNAFVKALNETV